MVQKEHMQQSPESKISKIAHKGKNDEQDEYHLNEIHDYGEESEEQMDHKRAGEKDDTQNITFRKLERKGIFPQSTFIVY